MVSSRLGIRRKINNHSNEINRDHTESLFMKLQKCKGVVYSLVVPRTAYFPSVIYDRFFLPRLSLSLVLFD